MVEMQFRKISYIVSRDFLAIPLSTVSSESAFRCAGRILGDHRSSLTPEMLETLVCAKDWLFMAKVPKSCSDSEDMAYLFGFAKLILLLSYYGLYFCANLIFFYRGFSGRMAWRLSMLGTSVS